MAHTTCGSRVGWSPGDYGFVPERCGKPATGSYVTKSGLRVGYCDELGHENRVRRIWAERIEVDVPEPVWLHEDPEYADPITAAKAEAERYDSWTDTGSTWEVAS